MSVVGGDVTEITFNHPTLGNGIIFPKSSEDSTYDLGGFRSNDDANAVDGGGNMMDEMSRVRWSLEATVAWDMNVRKDLETITAMAGSPVPAVWTWTNINGINYKATGKPVGDMQGNGKAATFSLKISGGGIAKQV